VKLQTFEQQVYRYQQRVYGFAYYYLKDKEEAADVTQEVLLRLWNHRDEVEEERMLGWLLRVTRNACVDALRKRKSYRRLIATDTEQVISAPGSMPATDAAAESSVFRQHLAQALDQLSEPYRSIVILREIQEMKYEEIGGALNLPLNTVKVYLHRARKMLRNQLREVLHRETV